MDNIKLFIKEDGLIKFIKEVNFSEIDEIIDIDFMNPTEESIKAFTEYGILGMQKVRVGDELFLAQMSEIKKGKLNNESRN